MAQWNKIDQDYLNQERSLFEVFNIATIDGEQVTTDNPFPVSIGGSGITIDKVTIGAGSTVDIGHIGAGNTIDVNVIGITTVDTNVVGITTVDANVVGISTIDANIVGITTVDANVVGINTVDVNVIGINTVTVGAGSSVSINNQNLDNYGRIRFSNPFTIAEYTNIYGPNTEMISKGVGSSVILQHNRNLASTSLIIFTDSTDSLIFQSRMYHHYTPGKSQLAIISFNFEYSRTNTVKRIGYYDEKNGIFLEEDGGSITLVRRTTSDSSLGGIDEIRVSQSNWNLDSMDGNGPSGINLDFEKAQTITFDFDWPTGKIRCAFIIDGNIIYFHEFLNSNRRSFAYWTFPALPIRCEIFNTQAQTNPNQAAVQFISATVIGEGELIESGYVFSKPTIGVTVEGAGSAPNNLKCALAIRCANTFNLYPNRTTVKITDIQVISNNSPCRWTLYRLPNNSGITGGSWSSLGPESAVEFNQTADTGFNLAGGYIQASGFVGISVPDGIRYSDVASSSLSGFISQNIDSNNSNIFALLVENLTQNQTTLAYTNFQWKEIR